MKTNVTLIVKSEGLNTKCEYCMEFTGHVDADEAVLNLVRDFEKNVDYWAAKSRRGGKSE